VPGAVNMPQGKIVEAKMKDYPLLSKLARPAIWMIVSLFRGQPIYPVLFIVYSPFAMHC